MIDLYGRFAALKLAKLMEKYPTRVYSKPEFTALPPYIFSGAEFALIPSRDEPFGLVAVEFGRKGALGVGARVGGLGQMPGWWFTVESTKATHLLEQFKHAIVAALKADKDTRALMRAYSAKQRFPVAQWLEKLEKLQSTAISVHDKNLKKVGKKTQTLLNKANHKRMGSSVALNTDIALRDRTPGWMGQVADYDDDDATTIGHSRLNSNAFNSPMGTRPGTPGDEGFDSYDNSALGSRPETPALAWAQDHSRRNSEEAASLRIPGTLGAHHRDDSQLSVGSFQPPRGLGMHENARASMLSLDEVTSGRNDFKLQNVDPFFTDSKGEFYSAFEKKLGDLTANNSTADLCIEDYLVKSEKEWFDMYRDARLGRHSHRPDSPGGSSRDHSRGRSRSRSRLNLMTGHERAPSALRGERRMSAGDDSPVFSDYNNQFDMRDDYIPPTGLNK